MPFYLILTHSLSLLPWPCFCFLTSRCGSLLLGFTFCRARIFIKDTSGRIDSDFLICYERRFFRDASIGRLSGMTSRDMVDCSFRNGFNLTTCLITQQWMILNASNTLLIMALTILNRSSNLQLLTGTRSILTAETPSPSHYSPLCENYRGRWHKQVI